MYKGLRPATLLRVSNALRAAGGEEGRKKLVQVFGSRAGLQTVGGLTKRLGCEPVSYGGCKCWVECCAKLALVSGVKPGFIVVDGLDIEPSAYRGRGIEPPAC